jgi:hypothetical protein
MLLSLLTIHDPSFHQSIIPYGLHIASVVENIVICITFRRSKELKWPRFPVNFGPNPEPIETEGFEHHDQDDD